MFGPGHVADIRMRKPKRGTVDEACNTVHINCMTSLCLRVNDSTVEMIDEIKSALEHTDGVELTKSHVIRLAIASMRKRMSDDGLLMEVSP